jgi:5'(3')-deoxyribonucleotidase
MTRIALDHDSTLAATWAVAFDLMHGRDHEFSYASLESWDWGLDTFGPERALSALWHAWTLRPLDVPPLEQNLAETVALLREDYEVDIVTAHPDHPGITEGKELWLDHHGIEYDNFVHVMMGETKADLDYDVYVDDKPYLCDNFEDGSKTQYMIRHRYNEHVAHPQAIHVDSVAEFATRMPVHKVA